MKQKRTQLGGMDVAADRPSQEGSTPGDALYPMGVVERLTGLSRRQIRYWETNGLLSPYRTRGGHRLFSPADVSLLQRVKDLRGRGFHTLEAVRAALGYREPLPGMPTPEAPPAPASPAAPSRANSPFTTTRHPGDAAIRLMAPLSTESPAGVARRLGRK